MVSTVSFARTRLGAAFVVALFAAGCGQKTTEKVIDRCAGVVCAAADVCHVAGVCSGDTGSCSNPPKAITPTVSPLSYTAPQAGVVYAGDLVQVDPPAVTLGCGPVAPGDVTWRWAILSAPPGSNAVLTSSVVAAPAFVPDVAGGHFELALTVTDRTGMDAPPLFLDVDVSPCGAHPPAPTLVAPSSPVDFRVPAALSASATDADDACPARFHEAANGTTFAWSVLGTPVGAQARLLPTDGAASALSGSAPGSYLVEVTATDGSGLTGTATAAVTFYDCAGALPILAPCSAGAGCSGTPVLQAVDGAGKTNPDVGDAVVLEVPAASVADLNAATCGASIPYTPFAWRWTLLSAPAGSRTQLSSSTSATPILIPDVVGSYELAVNVTDAYGRESATSLHTLATSWCGAYPPTVSIAIAPSTAIGALTLATLTATVADADNSCPTRFHDPASGIPVAWTVVDSPPGGLATLTSPTLSSTGFIAGVAGTYKVRATATDATGRSGHADATVAVSACGSSAPVLTSVVSPQSRPSVGSSVSLTATAYDADQVVGGTCGATPQSALLEYGWRLLSAPLGSAASVPPAFSADPAVSFVADVAGTFTFEVTARDSEGHLSQPMTVSVPTGACGPVLMPLVAPGGPLTVGNTISISAPSVLQDPCTVAPLSSLTRSWSFLSRPAGSTATFPSASNGLFVPDLPGTYTVQFLVTDPGGYATAESVSLVVGACTASPTVAIGASYAAPIAGDAGGTQPLVGDRVDLAAMVTPGNCGAASSASFTYSWTLLARPPGSAAVLGPDGSDAPSFVADMPGGSYQVAVTVTDALGNQGAAFRTFTISACGSQAPVATIANGAAVVTSTYGTVSRSGSASVSNAGCPARLAVTTTGLSWALVSAPFGGTALWSGQSGASVTFSPQAPSLGTPYRISLTATGSNGAAGSPAFIDVIADTCGAYAPVVGSVNAAPVLPPVGTPVALTATATDVDTGAFCFATFLTTDSLSWSWSLAAAPAGSTASILGPTMASPSFVPDRVGSYQVRVVVTDRTGRTGSNTATVVVPP